MNSKSDEQSDKKLKLIMKLFDTSLKNFRKKDVLDIDDDYITVNKNNKIEKTKNQSDSEKDENICFLFYAEIKYDSNGIFININNLLPSNNIYQNQALIDEVEKGLWYVIQPKKKGISRINRTKYFLKEGDIIKLGNIKFLINEISIIYDIKKKQSAEPAKDDKKKEPYEDINLEAEPFISEEIKIYKQCKACNGTYNIQICECEKKSHFSCFAQRLVQDGQQGDDKLKINYNKTNNDKVIKYYIPNFFCNECNCQYSFIYKIPESNTVLQSIKYDSIIRESYMIMESIGTKDKTAFIIILSKGDATIGNGKNKQSDVIIEDPSIKERHAKFVFDKDNGKVRIKSLYEKNYDFDTSVLIRKDISLCENKKIVLKVKNNVFIANALKGEDIQDESSDSSSDDDDDDDDDAE